MKFLACHEQKPRGTFNFPIELYYIDKTHPRYEMPLHWHMESEFIFILQGTLYLNIDEESIIAHKGDAVFVSGGKIHGGTPKDCIYECIVLDLVHFLRDSTVCRQELNDIISGKSVIRNFFKSGSKASELVKRLFEYMENETPGYELMTAGLLWEFIGTVLQQHLYDSAQEQNRTGGKHTIPVKNVLRRIRCDYSKPLTLEMLAREAGLKPHYLCRIFRQITGRTPIDYLNYYRIECAAELLCAGSESITEIALSCGFSDPSYFARLFRRQKGVSAREWRHIHAQ